MSSSSTTTSAASRFLFARQCSCFKTTSNNKTTYFRECSNNLNKYFEKNNLKKSIIKLVGENKYNDTIKYLERCYETREQLNQLIFTFCYLVLDISKDDRFPSSQVAQAYFTFLLIKNEKEYTFSHDNVKQNNSIFLSRLYDYLSLNLKNLKSYVTKPPHNGNIILEDNNNKEIDNTKECCVCLETGLVFTKKENFACVCNIDMCYTCAKKLDRGKCVACRKVGNFKDLLVKIENPFCYKHKGKTCYTELPVKKYSNDVNLLLKNDDGEIKNGIIQYVTSEDVEEQIMDNNYSVVLDWVIQHHTDIHIAYNYLHSVFTRNLNAPQIKAILTAVRDGNGNLHDLINPCLEDGYTDRGEETLRELLSDYMSEIDLETIIRDTFLGGDEESSLRQIADSEYLVLPEFLTPPPVSEADYELFNFDFERYSKVTLNNDFIQTCKNRYSHLKNWSNYDDTINYIVNLMRACFEDSLLSFKDFIENYLDHIRFVTFEESKDELLFKTEMSFSCETILATSVDGYKFIKSKNIRIPKVKITDETIETLLDQFRSKFLKLFWGFLPPTHNTAIRFIRVYPDEENEIVEDLEHDEPSNEIIVEN